LVVIPERTTRQLDVTIGGAARGRPGCDRDEQQPTMATAEIRIPLTWLDFQLHLTYDSQVDTFTVRLAPDEVEITSHSPRFATPQAGRLPRPRPTDVALFCQESVPGCDALLAALPLPSGVTRTMAEPMSWMLFEPGAFRASRGGSQGLFRGVGEDRFPLLLAALRTFTAGIGKAASLVIVTWTMRVFVCKGGVCTEE